MSVEGTTRKSIVRLLVLVLLFTLLCGSNVNALNLSPIERILLGSRLQTIQDQTTIQFTASQKYVLQQQKTHVILIFPGAGGPDDLTEELKDSIIHQYMDDDAAANESPGLQSPVLVEVWDWTRFRGSIVSAAFDGEAVGEAVAESLVSCSSLQSPAVDSTFIRSIHGIGISVGAFAAHAFTKRCKELTPETYTRLTLLDPFTSRGIWGIGYGFEEFGKTVDYAEHYLNTDDPVPTTNSPLNQHCCVYDVTNAKERDLFVLPKNETMHCWPVAYFARYGYQRTRTVVKKGKDSKIPTLLYHGKDNCPERGSIQTLS